jgi:L-malate glycosyltransferase
VKAPIPVLLMTYDLRVGGTERQLTEVALNLDRRNFTPHVACIHLQGTRYAELLRAGIPLAEFSFPSFGSPKAPAAALRLAAYLRRHRIRIVHAFDVPANIFAVPVSALSRIPVVLSSQRAFRELTPGWYHHMLRLTDFLVDATVVNSQNLRRHLIADDRLPPSHLILCYNSVDVTHFDPGPPVENVLPGASPIIGCTSMMRPEKGVGTLIEAFAAISRQAPSAGLLLVGGGPLQHDLEALAVRLGIRDRCHFAGPVSDVVPWLRRMDIFVLPSLSEAFSNSLLEAMAVGCACVASEAGGNPEIVQSGSTGYLFPPGDAAALQSRLQNLIADPAHRAGISAAGQAFVRAEFSREKSISVIERLYLSCLRRKGAEL